MALVPGTSDEVGALDVGRRAREAHADAGLGGERVDVGEVAHPAQAEDGDLERVAAAGGGASGRGASSASESSASSHSPSSHGSTPSVGRPVSAAQLLEPRGEDRVVAAELVDDEAGDERLVVGLEQREAAVERGEDAAAVDVADEHDREVGRAREAHVGQVARAQVDLGRAAGALADDDVVARAQVGERVEHGRAQHGLEVLVAARVGVGVAAGP